MLKLTRLREDKGWSRAELARRTGIHPAEIGKIEACRVRPYPSQIERIAAALGVKPGFLFDRNGWPLEDGRNGR